MSRSELLDLYLGSEVHDHWSAQLVTRAEERPRAVIVCHDPRPSAALRYQHATADRDRALAEALAGLAGTDAADISRTSDDETASVVRKIRPDQGAADRDRTGMISLEVQPPRFSDQLK